MNNLAICYENGIGTKKDLEKAFDLYQKAAENGDKEAQFNLGVCYEVGIGIEKDEVKASYWYQKAAQQGFRNAQYKPEFINKIDESIYCFKKAEKGSLNANEWIEKALNYEKVKFISYNELKNEVSFDTGGFGRISKAIWTKTNSYVICKKLANATYIKNDLLDAFIHELKMHLHLNYSDRIIRYFGISLDPKTNEYLLIMQYANGGDLQNHLKNNFKNLTWNDKKKLAFQIADGLNYLHNENILHRDLHSKNIVIHENNAKITDFGISKNQNNQSSTAYVGNFGVVAYMEPKRFIDPNFPYAEPSDIYSFGVLMWEISSGYPPFKDNDNKIALAVSISNGAREVTIPGTPKEYENLYKNCWNQEPEQRSSINEILGEFERMGFGNNVTNKLSEDNDNLTLELQASAESLEYVHSSSYFHIDWSKALNNTQSN
ncbi:kinase-like domain-containing protein [Rhizophagus irregularis DAOM 181602=DAOM 197198]|nr:kinase-like domain-containing protein [Rhizophagus irregularis DAOM 181602=DAOM 197198]